MSDNSKVVFFGRGFPCFVERGINHLKAKEKFQEHGQSLSVEQKESLEKSFKNFSDRIGIGLEMKFIKDSVLQWNCVLMYEDSGLYPTDTAEVNVSWITGALNKKGADLVHVLILTGHGITSDWSLDDHQRLFGDVDEEYKNTLENKRVGDICVYHCGLLQPKFIVEEARKAGVNHLVLIIDCCHAGGWLSYFKSNKDEIQNIKISVHVSCSVEESSYALRFIPALLARGIPLKALASTDLETELAALFDLPTQTPGFWCNYERSEGETLLIQCLKSHRYLLVWLNGEDIQLLRVMMSNGSRMLLLLV